MPIELVGLAGRPEAVARPREVVPEALAAGRPVLVGWARSDVGVVSDRLLGQVGPLVIERARERRVAREPVERAVASGARQWGPGDSVLLV